MQANALSRHRFHSICPYFAMFPEAFVARWLEQCTRKGDLVLDPFSGRGTAPFEALLHGRRGIGGDINPVAFVLTAAKVDSPRRASVERRLRELSGRFDSGESTEERRALPEFFGRAFHFRTLDELLFLRRSLNWRGSRVDRFIAALAIGSLHGEMDKTSVYFSNQMPRTISTKPRYSLKFWRDRGLWPERRRVFDLLKARLLFRFASEPPEERGRAFLADARHLTREASEFAGEVRTVITSPPYLDTTSFEEDQWLRRWMLGGPPYPTSRVHSRDDRHEKASDYWMFLCDAWSGVRGLLKKRSSLVCRIGGKGLDPEQLRASVLASSRFLARRSELVSMEVTELRNRQTDAFRPGSVGCKFEVDLHLELWQ